MAEPTSTKPSEEHSGASTDAVETAIARPSAAAARAEQAIMSLGWPYAAVPGALLGWPHAHVALLDEPHPPTPRHSDTLVRTWTRLSEALTRGTSDHPLARRVIGVFGLVLGGSAGLFIGGLGATLLAALLHPFVPHLANLALLSITLFSVAFGAIVGRRVLQRETFE